MTRSIFFYISLLPAFLILMAGKAAYAKQVTHAASQRGHRHFYIDPQKGSDQNKGTVSSKPWKTFAPTYRLVFRQGDSLSVLAGGKFEHTLYITGTGSAKRPVVVTFAPGRYEFFDGKAIKKKMAISNTNDEPDSLKAIAIYIKNARYVSVLAAGARLTMHAKMVETCIDSSQNIKVEGISYDYHIPTVSEFKVICLGDKYAELEFHKDSRFQVKDSLLYFSGDGWAYRTDWYCQEYDPAGRFLTRVGMSLGKLKYAKISQNRARVYYGNNPGFKEGFIYQTRDITRDCAGIFLRRSKNIKLKNARIYYMHGMGVVGQYCENIRIENLVVKPDEASGRHVAAWADILHFAGCRGDIAVLNSYLSGANDDAINIHGIHLRIIAKAGPSQLKLRFMHGQTYGFNPYSPGDSIALIRSASLMPFAGNRVIASEMLNDKEVLLTLADPVTAFIGNDDAVENITWTPSVRIIRNTFACIPTRAILITTRRKAVIEGNSFSRISSEGIVVEDDARGWFESGRISDLEVKNNNFIKCGEPVINIHPENTQYDGAVHRNIRVTANTFLLSNTTAFAAKSTDLILFNKNVVRFSGNVKNRSVTSYQNCSHVTESGNRIGN